MSAFNKNDLLEKNQDLVKTLDLILEQMEKINAVSGMKKNREDFIEDVATHVLEACGEVNHHDLKDPQFQKKLWMSIIGELVSDQSKDQNNNPIYNFNFKKLFDPKPELKPGQFQALFKELFTKLNELNPDPKTRLADQKIDRLTELAMRQMKLRLEPGKKNKGAEENLEEKELAEGLKNLYGGMDPRFPGRAISVVLCIIGDLAGIVDYAGGNETSKAFLDTLNCYNPTSTDSLGIQNQNLIRDQALDGMTAVIEKKTPFSTRPHLPGTT